MKRGCWRSGTICPFATAAAASAAEDNVAWFASLRVAAQRWLSSSRSITRAELPHRLATTLPAWRALLPARIRLTPAFATDPALTRLWQSIAALGVDVAAVADLPSHPQTLPTVERTRDPEHDRHRALCWADEMLASRSHDEVTLYRSVIEAPSATAGDVNFGSGFATNGGRHRNATASISICPSVSHWWHIRSSRPCWCCSVPRSGRLRLRRSRRR